MRYEPVCRTCRRFLHGGDYNPEQWEDEPCIWDEDVRLMQMAGCNAMSVGIFSWARLEPQEGSYDFGWLDDVMDRLHAGGISAVLATPSGARPAWMSRAYPEVLRVNADRVRNLHGHRHNHCYTSPVYRQKCVAINRALAERYGGHPALILWHVSNEYGGDCHCDLCQEAFRKWLKKRYAGDLDALNRAWWTRFWSHTYSDWDLIESPSPRGESGLHGLVLDWKRFVTEQTIDFFRAESAPLRDLTPEVPVTTNFMGVYPGLNYRAFAHAVDVVAWDCYPDWHPAHEENWEQGARIAFLHDLNRGLKAGRPFLMMESTPSLTNWAKTCKPKKPGMHLLASMQAVAHGSDSVQYFQWRKSRGGPEKLHGAVVGHDGGSGTRVFRDVTEVGRVLSRMDDVLGSGVRSDVAMVYDWETRWAIEASQGGVAGRMEYAETAQRMYRPFWKRGISVDVIGMEGPFDAYQMVIAPMLYMLREGVAESLTRFVEAGGTLVTTYWSGLANESDLIFPGGPPGPLRGVLGLWVEETDALHESERRAVCACEANGVGLAGEYEARDLCDLVHLEGARPLAIYAGDFYAGQPAVTVCDRGAGQAYYVASRNDARFLEDFLGGLTRRLTLRRVFEAELPEGVTAQMRTDDEREYVFVMNFQEGERDVDVGMREHRDLLRGGTVRGVLRMPGYGVLVLEREATTP